jgi:hypothetical protein
VETDTAPIPTQRPVPEFSSDSRPKNNASSDHGEREQTSSDRIDRHIVTSYQITRGEVCISSSSSTTIRNLSQDIQESSVADPHDFGPPGYGSISQRYGSGSGSESFCPASQVKRRPSATRLLLAPTQMALCLRLACYDF